MLDQSFENQKWEEKQDRERRAKDLQARHGPIGLAATSCPCRWKANGSSLPAHEPQSPAREVLLTETCVLLCLQVTCSGSRCLTGSRLMRRPGAALGRSSSLNMPAIPQKTGKWSRRSSSIFMDEMNAKATGLVLSCR